MDTFELNKYAGAVLGSLLLLYVVNEIGNVLVHPSGPAATAIAIEMPEGPDGPTPDDVEKPSLAALLAAADPAKGQKVAKKCVACHTFDSGGANRIGPNLYNIVGRDMATGAGFNYSSALQGMGGTWGYEELDAFLANPKSYIAGTKMVFAGIKKPAQRADVLVYLREQADSPQPLPTE